VPGHGGVFEDARGVQQVAVHHDRGRVAGEQCLGGAQHHRVAVDVDHPGRAIEPLRDLVHVLGGGEPDPVSTSCLMSASPTRYLTTRPRTSRCARTPNSTVGSVATIWSPSARSAA
jgi:hypothetical protein